MITQIYIATSEKQGFFKLPPEKQPKNRYLKKKSEQTIADQILSKFLPADKQDVLLKNSRINKQNKD